ncbi:hypothetical protein LTR91_012130 [Friedmanniomyces endolithicus]|uniref:Uncharacterized protein n=1 Tax=Friedmanniomyces endolithicus TaxID=329885 RepID=A0AAN6KG96_9PEZI|nr:hypothetical protein LTR35_002393 [Friedmanniomyces endolithicus]KAK0295845.1 hypothetical protein LTS00_005586 [Friedmanniomyces endolithicus]KAK0325816.1 hypothetical protein LTR82_003354 [Friedmanniomyces endolithicus]KAK0916191.1 hypothetical protein LTR57_013083 [Friedmanniomyces endolithicus]KAK0980739.1 hypothetical protein LTR91_012130 [Friedmanniomyces endolithicus]
MLPPQAGSGLYTARRHSSTTISSISHPFQATAAYNQARSFWSWRTARGEYSSHLDPGYQRFTRFRTMKTRAKLLEKLKRRGRFEWDLNQRPFFTPKHIRCASHFNSGRGGGGGPRWTPYSQENDPEQDPARKQSNAKALEEGYELSQREKEWKERMEYMRKRIESDPYEAVFGKRFEPFWSPLVPSWMREEMGLKGGLSKAPEKEEDKQVDEVVRAASAGRVAAVGTADKVVNQGPREDRQVGSKPLQKQQSSATKPKVVDVTAKTGTPQATSYSAYSSTSWDSWTNKTKRTEWDSTSGQLKQFEYDPVSNRMIPIPFSQAAVKAVEPAKVAVVTNDANKPSALQLRRADDMRSLINSPPARSGHMVVQIPVMKSFAVMSNAAPSGSMIRKDEDILKDAQWDFRSIHAREKTSAAAAPPPTALANLPANDLDLLTADDVRARMGKVREHSGVVRATTAAEKAAMEEGFDSSAAEWDKAENEIIRERESMKLKVKLGWAKKLSGLAPTFAAPRTPPTEAVTNEQTRLQTSVDRKSGLAATPAQAGTSGPTGLQPALGRMKPRNLTSTAFDPDDAAAHESTETVELPPSIPREWSQAADILQSSRVQRTASKKPFPPPLPRWIDDMKAKKAAHEAVQPRSSAAEQAKSDRLEKANALLAAEVQEQKVRMQAHEGRYAHKLRSLRGELDVAYKQSAVHAEKHVERIRFLEGEVAKTSKSVAGVAPKGAGAAKAGVGRMDEVVMQGEGDFCPNIANFAASERWYKMPTGLPPAIGQDAEQKARDQKLVREVREVYEREYGVIDATHRQPQKVSARSGYLSELASDAGPKRQVQTQTLRKQVVEVESDVDLGEALAEHEKRTSYAFRDDALEEELQAKEIEAHEAQALLMQPESAEKMKRVIAEKLASARQPPSEATPAIAKVTETPMTPWEHPPVYRILAYDSGNDMFSTATTTGNVTGTETPISIPQALSQLYQPARFVPHFAALQQEGWQVIHGTADLLVFRKVATVVEKPLANEAPSSTEEPAAETTRSEEDDVVGLIDHGVVTPKENALAQEAANFYDRYRPEPKEYDPTSIENGKLMPYENAMAQEAAHAYDAAIARSAAVNPIDGTMKSAPPTTGSVNHDRTFLDEVSSAKVKEAMNKKETAPIPEDVDYAPSSRVTVRRQEHVFSGTKRAESKAQRKWNERHERHLRREEARREGRRPGRRGGALKWALGVGVGAAGVAYAVGVAAEMARQERRERMERLRWREALEGRRGR